MLVETRSFFFFCSTTCCSEMFRNKFNIVSVTHLDLLKVDGIISMKPDCIPEIKGKAAREFEARVKLGPSVQQKRFLQEACIAYKKVKVKVR